MSGTTGSWHGKHNPTPSANFTWMDQGACNGMGIVLFYGYDGERQPEREAREDRAKAVCDTCPALYRCRDFAVSSGEAAGIWGGLNPDERKSERRRRMRKVNDQSRAAYLTSLAGEPGDDSTDDAGEDLDPVEVAS